MGLPYHIGPNKSSLHTTCHQPPNAYSSPQPNFCVNTSSAPNGGPMDFVESATLPNTAATYFPSHTRHLCRNTRPSTTRRTRSSPWSPFYGEPKFQVDSGSSISRAISFSGTPLLVEKYSPIRELSDDISMSHLPVTWRLYTETPRQRENDAFGLYRTCA